MAQFLSVLGYLGMFGGLLGLFVTGSVFSLSPLAIVPQALAVLLMLWARLTFGMRSFHFAASPTEGGLVTTGPYRWIRHPIYTSVCLFTAGCLAAHPSWLGAAFGALVLAGALTRIGCEEPALRARYPRYAEYARRTRRMIPFVF